MYEICVTILNLNVFGTLTETSYDSIILLKKVGVGGKKTLPPDQTRKKFKCSDFDVEKWFLYCGDFTRFIFQDLLLRIVHISNNSFLEKKTCKPIKNCSQMKILHPSFCLFIIYTRVCGSNSVILKFFILYFYKLLFI